MSPSVCNTSREGFRCCQVRTVRQHYLHRSRKVGSKRWYRGRSTKVPLWHRPMCRSDEAGRRWAGSALTKSPRPRDARLHAMSRWNKRFVPIRKRHSCCGRRCIRYSIRHHLGDTGANIQRHKRFIFMFRNRAAHSLRIKCSTRRFKTSGCSSGIGPSIACCRRSESEFVRVAKFSRIGRAAVSIRVRTIEPRSFRDALVRRATVLAPAAIPIRSTAPIWIAGLVTVCVLSRSEGTNSALSNASVSEGLDIVASSDDPSSACVTSAYP